MNTKTDRKTATLLAEINRLKREQEIEAALERVRAQSMAMHLSQDLQLVVNTVIEQLQELKITLDTTNIIIFNRNDRSFNFWTSSNSTGKLLASSWEVPYLDYTWFKDFAHAFETGQEVFTDSYSGEQKKTIFDYLFTSGGFKDLPDERKKFILDSKVFTPMAAIVTDIAIQVVSYSRRTFSPEEIEIIKRFAKVFKQTYTRFLDLQKAEAQARQAEIELALERVRAKSMAMHTTFGLADVIETVFKQFELLNIRADSCFINIHQPDSNDWNLWVSTGGRQTYQLPVLPYLENPVFRKQLDARKKSVTFYTALINKKAKDQFFDHFFNHLTGLEVSKDRLDYIYNAKGIATSFTLSNHATIALTNYSCIPYSDEENLILQRIGNVFQQTYTRFLDLKKAEAQAREAQIEAALERIRSASMAMHKSEELPQVALTFLTQIEELAIPVLGVGLAEINKETNTCVVYFADNTEEGQNRELSISKEFEVNEFWLAEEGVKRMKSGKKEFTVTAEGERLELWIEWIDKIFSKKRAERLRSANLDKVYFHTNQFHDYSNIIFSSLEPLSEEYRPVIKRLVSTFKLSYLRFLDLQKAEAQSREAEIQLALERVRARTMAMHKSEELSDTAAVMFQELKKLGINSLRSGVCIFDFNNNSAELWLATESGDKTEAKVLGTVTASLHPIYKQWIDAGRQKKQMVRFDLSGDELINYYKIANAQLNLPNRTDYTEHEVYYGFIFPGGSINVISLKPLTNEECEIGYRFANVFGLLYRRFQDLQKSEAQAREAQIEAALERVRAKALAMQSSGDLIDVAQTLREQMGMLGQPDLESSIIHIYNETANTFEAWYSFRPHKNPTGKFITGAAVDVPIELTEWGKEAFLKYKSKETQYSIISDGEKLKDWYNKVLKVYAANTVEYDDKGKLIVPDVLHYYFSKFSGGALLMISDNQPKPESIELQARAAQVFNFAYQRFLDLKMAEGQAREAQIEVALERIRAKALAMQSSADLHDVSIVLREQMGMLGQPDLESSIVHLYNNSESLESWYTFRSTETNSEKIVTDVAFIPVDSCEYIKETIEKYNSDESEYTIVSKGKKLADWYHVMEKVAPETIEYDTNGKILIPKILYYHHSKFGGGALLLISNQPPSEESKELQRRAARVFNFAYQRFLDLKKAEEQAHEAKIEASLERVRSQTMAMQHSDDLIHCTTLIFEEFERLNLSVQRCGIGVVNSKTKDCQLWTTVVTEDGEKEIVTGVLSLSIHPMLKGIFKAWAKRESFLYVLEGKELKDYYKIISKSGFRLPDEVISKAPTLPKQYCYFSLFGVGGLYVFSEKEPTVKEKQIVRRFSEVFNLTYTRYEDLQKAEDRAKEATKQASLDRVRGEIASMRSRDDLTRITPLIWHELTVLGVPFIRCGVFIMDNDNSVIQSFLSTPEGKSLGMYNLPYNATEIAVKMVTRWKKGKAYNEHWDKKQFANFIQAMAKRGLIQNQQTYRGDAAPEALDLHFVPFKQGMLYAGNTAPLSEESLQLLKSLAEAFSIAYSRYEDFTQLEAAKKQTDRTLEELKSAQTQLIQSEKMASLGELTAGIAHEIQNPLNFVNNFSEVSKELIEELREERGKNTEERDQSLEEEILADVIQNLDKINHHGQRASDIVKSMLEHSRTGTREKELTDINVLADEYLRLSYHGLRAKDKSFNADFKAELDPSLPKVNIIGQDIGRVLLNLINNAFYAVSEKAKKGIPEYQPQVTVKTRKANHLIEIKVKDNADGIPPNIVNKIFQPFFTTKPTGSGTGLGLSLSYDIVTLGHNGTLEVDTAEGLGSEFIIQLPITAKT